MRAVRARRLRVIAADLRAGGLTPPARVRRLPAWLAEVDRRTRPGTAPASPPKPSRVMRRPAARYGPGTLPGRVHPGVPSLGPRQGGNVSAGILATHRDLERRAGRKVVFR